MSDDLVCVLMALWWANEGGLSVDEMAATIPAAFQFLEWVCEIGPRVATALGIDGGVGVWWGAIDVAKRRAAIERAMRGVP